MQQDIVFACTCSRKMIEAAQESAAQNTEARYPGTCRHALYPFAKGVALRMAMPDSTIHFHDLWQGSLTQCPAQQCGDLLLRDRDGNWTYQFAVAVDDFNQGINLIIRGEDLLDSVGRQILLAQYLGRPAPATFAHHPLLYATESTEKLSKRQASEGIGALRAKGLKAEEVLARAAVAMGLCPDSVSAISLDELLGAIAYG